MIHHPMADADVARPWRHTVEQRFAEVAKQRLPLPGGGATRERWAAFARLAGEDLSHGRRVADLTVYLRQHHAERDLAALGGLVTGEAW